MSLRRKNTRPAACRLLADERSLFDDSYQAEIEAKQKQPVECLGMTFENCDARRAHFLEKLAEKLKEPEFRKIEGF